MRGFIRIWTCTRNVFACMGDREFEPDRLVVSASHLDQSRILQHFSSHGDSSRIVTRNGRYTFVQRQTERGSLRVDANGLIDRSARRSRRRRSGSFFGDPKPSDITTFDQRFISTNMRSCLWKSFHGRCVVLSQPICSIPLGKIPKTTSRAPDDSFFAWTKRVDPVLVTRRMREMF